MAQMINGIGPLTTRQVEILGLIGECCTNEEIGAKLGLRASTVRNQVHEIYSILEVGEGGATPRIKTIKWAQENLTQSDGEIFLQIDRATTRLSDLR